VDGPLSLYKHVYDHHFLEKFPEPLVEISNTEEVINGYLHKSKRFIGVFKFITSDCPSVNREFDKLKYRDEDLIKAV
jgi:hypothetical protein